MAIPFVILAVPGECATTLYVYDSLNRLTRLDYGNGLMINYIYDAAGNRLSYSASALPEGPTITQHPQQVTAPAGGTVLFSVSATGPSPLSYQWQREGRPIAGASAATLTLSAVNAAAAGFYTVVVTNASGSITSQPALLTVLQTSFAGWQSAYFTPQEIADSSGMAAASADPNNDGISNWMSFVSGLDPTGTAKSGDIPGTSIQTVGTDRYLAFTYRRLIGTTSIPYTVCVSHDLLVWDETETQIEQIGNVVPTGDGLTETVAVRLKVPLDDLQPPRKFLRLKIGSAHASTTLFEDNFDDNALDPARWVVVQNGGTRIAEEAGVMKVETTQTDRPGKLRTQSVPVQMDRPWTLTRRVFLHRDTPFSHQGGDKFFTGYMRFLIDQMQPFGVYYCDYDYAGDSPGSLPKHGFVLAKNGAGGTTNPNTGNVTSEITPLLLDQWFDEKVSFNPTSGLMQYFINNILRSEFNVGTPPDSLPRNMQIEFEAYGWWTTHRQHFDDILLKAGE